MSNFEDSSTPASDPGRASAGAVPPVRISRFEGILIFVLALIFMALFVGLLYFFPGRVIFQSIVLISTLTIVFTGLLRASGAFKTQGRALTGAAAVFVIMFLVVEGSKEVSPSAEMEQLRAENKELRKFTEDRVLKLAVRGGPRGATIVSGLVIQIENDQFDNIELTNPFGSFEIPVSALVGSGYIFIDSPPGVEPEHHITLTYDDQKPEIQLFVPDSL